MLYEYVTGLLKVRTQH